MDLDLEINKDFEENSPYQEGIISEIYQRPDKSQLLEPSELAGLINTNCIVQKYLPKQTDIDKILKIIQRKILKGTHLPVTIRDTSRISKQSIFQRYILVLSIKQIAKFQEYYRQN